MFKKPIALTLAAVMLIVFSGSIFLQRCKPADKNSTAQGESAKFVGDQACKSCHLNEYHDWLKSDHFMAMQPATDSFVKGDFNNTSFTADGVTNTFFRKNEKFFINTQGEDGKNHDYEVKYIFGHYPLQQYLVEFPGGKMQVPRVSWDVKSMKWFHQYAGQKIDAHDWFHWTGNSQNWNTMCASCHSTNLQKNYTIDNDSFHTTYSTINVSCESCHGAGSLHIDYVNGSDYKAGKKTHGSLLQLYKMSGQLAQINTCAPCHARKSEISASQISSTEIMDNYIPEIPDTEHYHADGQVNDEDYIYTSFLQSKMFSRNVQCSNCHNPHSGKLVLPGNQTCLQCHAKTYDDPSHTFHPAGIEASTCVSCHMPGKLYMGNDLRHDHSLRVPRPDLSVKYQTPNACNNCHKEKTAKWAADAITKWYGPVRKYHFADDLVPGSKLDENSEAHLTKLIADTAVPAIVKATAVKYLGSLPTQTSLQALIRSLSSNEAQIRYRALRSLPSFSPSSWIDAVGELLTDSVRAVRIAAADMFTGLPTAQIPQRYVQQLAVAQTELQSYLYYQADFSVGNLMIADNAFRRQDYTVAEKFYLRGLKMDSMMNYARINLSTVYNVQHKNEKAVEVLQTAFKTDPKNDQVCYNLGLLYNELNNQSEAEKYFAKAVALQSQNSRLYYNYGLLLTQNKKFKEAELLLQKAIGKIPDAGDLYYALTFVYLQTNDIAKARQTATQLKQLDPVNPNYQELYKNLGL